MRYEDEIEELVISAVDLCDHIENKIDNEPPKGKLHTIWKKETNKMIDEYNRKFGKVYTHVK